MGAHLTPTTRTQLLVGRSRQHTDYGELIMTMPFEHVPVLEAGSVLVAAALVWLSAIAQHSSNVITRGAKYVMSDRSVAPEMDGFYGRASRTLTNNIESALMYIPPMLVLIIFGGTNSATQIIAAGYVVARCLFSIAYWFKVSAIRSFSWLTGMICCTAVACFAALTLIRL